MTLREVSPEQILCAFRQRCMAFVFVVAIWPFSPELAFSQIVQLPSTGTFSLQTSVLAPDSGAAYLGGNQRSAWGSRSLGPGSQALGGTTTSARAMVRATIIDLNELDIMIRSQAGTKPAIPDLDDSGLSGAHPQRIPICSRHPTNARPRLCGGGSCVAVLLPGHCAGVVGKRARAA